MVVSGGARGGIVVNVRMTAGIRLCLTDALAVTIILCCPHNGLVVDVAIATVKEKVRPTKMYHMRGGKRCPWQCV